MWSWNYGKNIYKSFYQVGSLFGGSLFGGNFVISDQLIFSISISVKNKIKHEYDLPDMILAAALEAVSCHYFTVLIIRTQLEGQGGTKTAVELESCFVRKISDFVWKFRRHTHFFQFYKYNEMKTCANQLSTKCLFFSRLTTTRREHETCWKPWDIVSLILQSWDDIYEIN